VVKRKRTHQITVGSIAIGGSAPISVQSMTKTDTRNIRATVAQIKRLEKAGCEIVRVAVPDEQAVLALPAIVKKSSIPVIADIHFHHLLALKALDAGVAGLRINPGNIGNQQKIKAIVNQARQRAVAIRIGVNSGSLERNILKKYGSPTPEALVESALRHIQLFEKLSFTDIKVSLKSPDVRTMVAAYRQLSKKTRYPLHLGVTEAGTAFSGTIKSAVGLGILLAEGIGDTLRVSLTADPVEEVRVGFEILKVLGLRQRGPEIISCPTCGRCHIDVACLTHNIEKRLSSLKTPLKIAVMGCEVNGPGEAREADIGIAGSKTTGILFKKGVIIKRCKKSDLLDAFYREVSVLADNSEFVI
jgi:(E)-4-hydroxy-3-methylbut-2-enyl-diphosphate synthase